MSWLSFSFPDPFFNRFALVNKFKLPSMPFSKDLFKNIFKNLVSSRE